MRNWILVVLLVLVGLGTGSCAGWVYDDSIYYDDGPSWVVVYDAPLVYTGNIYVVYDGGYYHWTGRRYAPYQHHAGARRPYSYAGSRHNGGHHGQPASHANAGRYGRGRQTQHGSMGQYGSKGQKSQGSKPVYQSSSGGKKKKKGGQSYGRSSGRSSS